MDQIYVDTIDSWRWRDRLLGSESRDADGKKQCAGSSAFKFVNAAQFLQIDEQVFNQPVRNKVDGSAASRQTLLSIQLPLAAFKTNLRADSSIDRLQPNDRMNRLKSAKYAFDRLRRTLTYRGNCNVV